MELSVGAVAAWQIAGWEAAWLKHQYVEKEHLLCGICSLEKMLDNERVELDDTTRGALESEQHGVTLKVSEEAEELLLRSGLSAAFGARELRRTVERMLEMPLSQMVLKGRTAGTWRVAAKSGGLTISPLPG